MSRIEWDALGERRYEIGVDRGVFYESVGGEYINGIAWNGLTGVEDSSEGRESTPLYSGDVKVAAEYTPEAYAGTIRCYTYPDDFEKYLGEEEIGPGVYARQQDRDLFGFCYRTLVGNDSDGTSHGYKLHLVYNMIVTDFSRSYSTVNSSTDIPETTIGFDTFAVITDSDNYEPLSEIVIDSRTVDATLLASFEDILYGTANAVPRLPWPDEIIEMFYVPQPIPPEWYLFPNNAIYPDDTLYPYVEEE